MAASTGLSRRTAIRLIGGSAAAAALASLTTAREASATEGEQGREAMASFGAVGTIVSASRDRLVISSQARTLHAVRAAHSRAYVGATGRVRDFAAFIPGDKVFVEGSRQGDSTVVASSVGSVLQPVRLTVTGLDGTGHASTTLGTVDLRGSLPDLEARAEFQAGDVISGYTWSDPSSGETFLLVPPRSR